MRWLLIAPASSMTPRLFAGENSNDPHFGSLDRRAAGGNKCTARALTIAGPVLIVF